MSKWNNMRILLWFDSMNALNAFIPWCHYFPARFRVGIRYRFDVFRMDTSEQLAFMECISMLAIARMIMNACIAFSIWHVETEYRMIQASPIHLHYQHMKEVFYRNYRHHISLWRSLNCVWTHVCTPFLISGSWYFMLPDICRIIKWIYYFIYITIMVFYQHR